MKLTVNIEKRYFFGILIGILVVAGVLIGYAMTAGVAPNPGHVIDNVSAPAGCQANQILQWTGSSWTCINMPSSGSGFAYFYGSVSYPLFVGVDDKTTFSLISGREYSYYAELRGASLSTSPQYQFNGYIRYRSDGGLDTKIEGDCSTVWVLNGLANCTLGGSNGVFARFVPAFGEHVLPVFRLKEYQGTHTCSQTVIDYPGNDTYSNKIGAASGPGVCPGAAI